MKLISKAELESRGWKVEGHKVPRKTDPGYEWRYDLIAPDGSIVTTEMCDDNAWEKCPDKPENGFIEDYDWTASDKVAILDPRDTDGIEAIQHEYGPWGTSELVLTRADIDALLAGKCIVWGQDEYSSIIYFHDASEGER